MIAIGIQRIGRPVLAIAIEAHHFLIISNAVSIRIGIVWIGSQTQLLLIGQAIVIGIDARHAAAALCQCSSGGLRSIVFLHQAVDGLLLR